MAGLRIYENRVYDVLPIDNKAWFGYKLGASISKFFWFQRYFKIFWEGVLG
jgi:hypothetical protein